MKPCWPFTDLARRSIAIQLPLSCDDAMAGRVRVRVVTVGWAVQRTEAQQKFAGFQCLPSSRLKWEALHGWSHWLAGPRLGFLGNPARAATRSRQKLAAILVSLLGSWGSHMADYRATSKRTTHCRYSVGL